MLLNIVSGQLELAPSMVLQPASPASPLALSASEQANQTNVGYGQKSQDLFAIYDPDSSFWKTPQGYFLPTEGRPLERYSKTWPQAGMMRSGKCYRLRRLVRRISGIGSGLWPTPMASDVKRLVFSIEQCHRHIANQAAKGRRATLSIVEAMAVEFGLRPTAEFGEWLMRFPKGWTDMGLSVTPSIPLSLNGSVKELEQLSSKMENAQ